MDLNSLPSEVKELVAAALISGHQTDGYALRRASSLHKVSRAWREACCRAVTTLQFSLTRDDLLLLERFPAVTTAYVTFEHSFKLGYSSPAFRRLRKLSLRCQNPRTAVTLMELETANLAGLTNLELHDVRLLQLDEQLADLTALKELRCFDGLVATVDFSVLSGLTALTVLRLDHCGYLSNVSALSGLSGLEVLRLDAPIGLDNVSPVSCLTALKYLWLDCRNLPDVSSLSCLANLVDLRLDSLMMTEDSCLDDLRPLSCLTKLTRVELGSCGLADWHGVVLGRPVDVTLDSRLNKLRDVAPLAYLGNLVTLRLSCCAVLEDISPLACLSSLEELHLSFCLQLEDVSPLSGLTNLLLLQLHACHRVQDFSELACLTQLTIVRAGEVPCFAELLAE